MSHFGVSSNSSGCVFFSIIIVTFNAEKYIAKTLTSLKIQEHRNFEIILIDGGSSDRTIEIANSFLLENMMHLSEKDEGIYDAMNKGLSLCSGEYVYFINANDYLESAKVLLNISELIVKYNHPDILYGDIITYEENSDQSAKYVKQPEVLSKELLMKRTICHQSLFAKKELFVKYGKFDTSYKICADFYWLSEMVILYDVDVTHVAYPVCYYSTDGVSSTRKYAFERFRALLHFFSFQYLVRCKYIPWIYKRIHKKSKRILRLIRLIG